MPYMLTVNIVPVKQLEQVVAITLSIDIAELEFLGLCKMLHFLEVLFILRRRCLDVLYVQ